PSTSVVSSLFHDTAPTEIHPLSLHDALPICGHSTFSKASAQVLSRFYGTDAILFTATSDSLPGVERSFDSLAACADEIGRSRVRSEEHTSELQSRENLVCRLLLEKKKKKTEQ